MSVSMCEHAGADGREDDGEDYIGMVATPVREALATDSEQRGGNLA